MDTILELEAARLVCERKIESLSQHVTYLNTKNEFLKEAVTSEEKDKLDKLDKLPQELKSWMERLQKINSIIYDLVEKTF